MIRISLEAVARIRISKVILRQEYATAGDSVNGYKILAADAVEELFRIQAYAPDVE